LGFNKYPELVLICIPESLEPVTCFALDEAIDELDEGLGVSRFSVFERKFFFSQRVKLQKCERVEKVSEMCVIDIYI